MASRVMFLADSKNCHLKNFGTKDLRHANLPNRDQVTSLSPPTSPHRDTRALYSPPTSPPRPTPASTKSTTTRGSIAVPPQKPPLMTTPKVSGEAELPTSDGRNRINDFPGHSPLSPMQGGGDEGTVREEDVTVGGGHPPRRPQIGGTTGGVTLGRKDVMAPLVPTSTGTRYGRGLTGVAGGTNRQWGGGTPVCPKCGKLVYFAEQVSKKQLIYLGSDVETVYGDEGNRANFPQRMSALLPM
jgi:hypothetical protein